MRVAGGSIPEHQASSFLFVGEYDLIVTVGTNYNAILSATLSKLLARALTIIPEFRTAYTQQPCG